MVYRIFSKYTVRKPDPLAGKQEKLHQENIWANH